MKASFEVFLFDCRDAAASLLARDSSYWLRIEIAVIHFHRWYFPPFFGMKPESRKKVSTKDRHKNDTRIMYSYREKVSSHQYPKSFAPALCTLPLIQITFRRS